MSLPRTPFGPAQLSTLLALLLTFSTFTSAVFFQQLVRDGVASDIKGYKGTSWQAIRYEPLCGNLGQGAVYASSLDVGDKCTAAMNAFGNSSSEVLSVYDLTGTKLQGGEARVGNGAEVCMCMAMRQSSGTGMGAICLWVDGTGRGDYEYFRQPVSDYIYVSSYRVVDRAMPLCNGFDLASAKSQWSSTAIQAAAQATGTTTGTATGRVTTGTAGKSLDFNL